MTNQILKEVIKSENVKQPHMSPQHNVEQKISQEEQEEKVTNGEENASLDHDVHNISPLKRTDQ